MPDRSFPPSLLALTDVELEIVMGLSAPILQSQRGAFLQALAAELQANPDAVGSGAIHRLGRELQRRFLRHTEATRGHGVRLHERR
jgi:hypothetical protein